MRMFTFEGGSGKIIDQAMDRYEKKFGTGFPLYEHIDITRSDQYDFALKGAERLANWIDGLIKTNTPAPKPADYDERIY